MLKLTHEEFVAKANALHNSKYTYPDEYVNNKTKIRIICPSHGEFYQIAGEHLRGRCCYKCSLIVNGLKHKKSNKEFIEEANKIHNCKYTYPDEYMHSQTKIKIICSIHGEFYQTPSSHLQGNGCPSCKSSKGEEIIRKILEDNNIKFTPQKKYDNCKNILPLPFDFHLTDYDILVEYDGIQHFKPIDAWDGLEGLKMTKRNDRIKTNYCKKNNIKLFRIKYTDNVESKMIEILESFK